MKIKKCRFSTVISDLYGKDNYQKHIKKGKEYWYFFEEGTDIYKATHKHWNKLRITYIRSGCLFYDFPEVPEVKEDFCPINCFMTSTFVLSEIDPIKDLKKVLGNIEAAKIQYCFDDEHTIVKNWPNEKEIEVDEDEIFEKFGNSAEYIFIKALEIKEY